jgi:hypothetical protein
MVTSNRSVSWRQYAASPLTEVNEIDFGSELETGNLKLYSQSRGAVAQFGRAPRSQCGGQGFDPPLLHQNPSILNYLQDRSKGLEFPNDQICDQVFLPEAEIAF